MKNAEYCRLIGKRLKYAIERLQITQKDIILKCGRKGYSINQSALSKLLSGTGTSVMLAVQVCDTLELDVSEVLSLKTDKVTININPDLLPSISNDRTADFIVNADDSAFRAYMGDFNAYFYTTKSEDNLHTGKFTIKKDVITQKCVIDFSFKTGDKNENGEDVEKKYSGPLYYSDNMKSLYAELTSQEIVEKSYIIFHYNFLTNQIIQCRLATVLTVSSGLRRLPTMHKMLLTRKKLTEEDLGYLCGQLKLNSSEITISENAYHEFLRDEKLPERFFEYFGEKATSAERFLRSVAEVNYYSFNESLISDSFLPDTDKVKIICLLRKYSSAPRYNKISEKAEEIIYKYLNKKENLENNKV